MGSIEVLTSYYFITFFAMFIFTDSWFRVMYFKTLMRSARNFEQIVVDEFSCYFLVFRRLVVFRVLTFSAYYMSEEESKPFFFFVLTFLGLMWFLVVSQSLTTMFIGWEGVGIISFLLIGWFARRDLASFSSKKAVLMNRFTDFFFFAAMRIEIFSGGVLIRKKRIFEKDSIEKTGSVLLESSRIIVLIVFLSLLGKSAQFIFHPWLTRAMEGPTPVRSLLHRSTMVMAGVYLFIKMDSFIRRFRFYFLLFSFVFSFTLFFISLSGFFYKDYKKVIAISTTRQLSFIITLCYIGEKELAFLHMILHSFFKASLFIFRGFTIHSGESDQDSRKSKVLFSKKSQKTIFLVSILGLLGAPFLGAFFSKHSFVSMLFTSPEWDGSNYHPNVFTGVISLISLLITSVYRVRLMMRSRIFNNLERIKVMSFFEREGLNIKISQLNLFFWICMFGFLSVNIFMISFPGRRKYILKRLLPTGNLGLHWIFPFILLMGFLLNLFLKKSSWISFNYFYSRQIIFIFFHVTELLSKKVLFSREKTLFLNIKKEFFGGILKTIKKSKKDERTIIKRLSNVPFIILCFSVALSFYH